VSCNLRVAIFHADRTSTSLLDILNNFETIIKSCKTRILIFTMRFSTAIVGLSMATAFTTPSVTIRIHPSTTSARISLEDLSDKLIADNATGDNAAKLALLQQNYKGLVSSTIPALQDLVEGTSTTLNIAAYGPWYVAAACLFVAASQRSAGRDEARSELVEKIVKGELNVEEVRTVSVHKAYCR
jgi:hypothetical protein